LSGNLEFDLATDVLGRGACGVVFCNTDRTRAFKLFFNQIGNTNPRMRGMFESELSALELANRDPELKQHVPRLFDGRRVMKVTDSSGKNRADAFLLDCCIEMELICRPDKKVRCINYGKLRTEIEKIKDRLFTPRGLWMRDASVFLRQRPLKFIDFGTEDHPLAP
jgi:hypothetical protein